MKYIVIKCYFKTLHSAIKRNKYNHEILFNNFLKIHINLNIYGRKKRKYLSHSNNFILFKSAEINIIIVITILVN